MSWVRMVEEGVAIGLVVFLILMVIPSGIDDYSVVFWPAGQAADPYGSGMYFYPVWNTWALRALAMLPRGVGVGLIGIFNVIVVMVCAHVWGVPAWIVFVSPVFLLGFLSVHPFEGVVLAGVTLAWVGYQRRQAGLVGVGVMLCLFKLQIGLLPALWLAFCTRRRLGVTLVPASIIVAISLLDWRVTGRLWVGPWLSAMWQAPGALWNASPVRLLGVLSAGWIPIGLWFGYKVQGFQRRVWLAMAVSLLISPYWGIYSLWPLLAMAGCWRGENHG